MAKSVDPDQMPHSGSTLFAQVLKQIQNMKSKFYGLREVTVCSRYKVLSELTSFQLRIRACVNRICEWCN